jgi:ferredoxin-NADP reductase
LLYCVRTNSDVIFESELEQLGSRLKNFRYHLLLSQAHAEWSGPRGHVSREFIQSAVKDVAAPDFFLCGPPAFMDLSRAILIEMGVRPERIMQESFGGSVPRSAPPVSAPAGTDGAITFARSGKTCTLRSGQTAIAGGRGAWSGHTFILPAGSVWNLQNETIGRNCAHGR